VEDLRVVIPAYNEEASIGKVIDEVKNACPGAQVVVVDDGSRDSTATNGRQKGAEVVSNPTNYGYGKALKIGFNYNLDRNRSFQYLAFLDADGTYPPHKIPELYYACKQKNIDLVVGSRLLNRNDGMPMMRKIGNMIFASLLSLYSGKNITDTGSGLRVFKASLIAEFENFPDGLNFTPAMTALIAFKSATYAEIPIEYHRRVGRSKLRNLRDGYLFLKVIMEAIRRHRPILFFFTLGIPFTIVQFSLRAVSSLKSGR
jgi:glycosyltransferase involved in cell wall biosynthesis